MTNQTARPHLNFALVEDTRPPMYTAMKYWGKKPHNIWGQFIERYCPPEGTVLDPFAGSAIAAFEAVKINRKVIAFDLNPLTAFIVEALASKFDEALFIEAVVKISSTVEKDLFTFVITFGNIKNKKELYLIIAGFLAKL